jgi:rod shape-determining protein MreC
MRQSSYLPLRREVGVFLLLVLLSSSILVMERVSDRNPITGQLAWVFMPFEKLANRLMNLTAVYRENQILRTVLARTRRENAALREAVHETERLRSLLGFKRSSGDSMTPSRVLTELGPRMGGGLVIDRGMEDGLRKNMTVMSTAGLVGRIVRTAGDVSHVKRITDPGNRVSAMLQRSRATGILRTPGPGRMVMEWVAPDTDVAQGDTVVSSGFGAVFTKGIPIGKVTSVREQPERFSLSLEVRPFVDFSRLEEVFVLLSVPRRFPELGPEEAVEGEN